MKPLERTGHDSIVSDAPVGHSVSMLIPSSAWKKNRKAKFGANFAMKLQAENHRMEIISGSFRPILLASQPEAVAPTRRSYSVIVNTAVTATRGTPNSCEIGTMMRRKMVK